MADVDVSVAAEETVPVVMAEIEVAPIEAVAVEPADDAALVAMDGPADVDALRHNATVMGEINAATSGVIRDMNIEASQIYDFQRFGELREGMVIWEGEEATELPTQPAEQPTTPDASHDPHEALHDAS